MKSSSFTYYERVLTILHHITIYKIIYIYIHNVTHLFQICSIIFSVSRYAFQWDLDLAGELGTKPPSRARNPGRSKKQQLKKVIEKRPKSQVLRAEKPGATITRALWEMSKDVEMWHSVANERLQA